MLTASLHMRPRLRRRRLIDTIVRFPASQRRENVLCLPGHSTTPRLRAVAWRRQIKAEGHRQQGTDLGRVAFLERAWRLRRQGQSGGTDRGAQLRRLGLLALDWKRESASTSIRA